MLPNEHVNMKDASHVGSSTGLSSSSFHQGNIPKFDQSMNSIRRTLESGPSASNFKRDDSNLLKSTFKLGSDSNLRPNPRTSMSQLKLYQLSNTDATYKDLKRFDLEELRNGFFDPIYVNPKHTASLNEHYHEKPKTSTFLNRCKQSFHSHFQNFWKDFNNSKIILTKFFIAYFISIILCLVEKPGNWFGRYRVFLPISTLINHPVHSIGAQLEITILSIVGLAIGLGWSSLALYISTATQPTRNHQGGILAGSLFIGIFFMGWFKAYFIRFYYLFLSSGFVLIFLSTNLDLRSTVINWKDCWNIGIPYLFGLLVSLFVSLVFFPDVGHEKILNSILDSVTSIKDLIVAYTEAQEDDDSDKIFKLTQLQKDLTYKTLMLSENFREYLSEVKVSIFLDEDLKKIRNHLNFAISPLRAIPSPTHMYFKPTAILETSQSNEHSTDASGLATAIGSGMATPLPKPNVPLAFMQHPHFGNNNKLLYTSIINEAFNEPLFKLLTQMIDNLAYIETSLKKFGKLSTNDHESKQQILESLKNSQLLLKKRVWQIDAAYKKFTKSESFCRDLLNEETVIDMFLFLRYSRQSATMMISLSEVVEKSCEHVSRWKFFWYNYPWRRSLRRLPKQCLRDQGADSIFYYFETKLDVDDAFERIYNLNTSRIKSHHHEEQQEKEESSHPLAENGEEDIKKNKTIRAIDHNDFSYHSTDNPLRFKLWRLSRRLNDSETKYAFKIAFVLVFLSLPAWLKESNHWYYQYNCFWTPLLVYYFLSPRNSGNWENLSTRIICWFIGCFWGWAANQARHFRNPIVIGAFAAIICVPFAFGFLVKPHPRSSLIALMSFTIISINCYVQADSDSTDAIFDFTWTTSVAILISVVTSIFTNWLIWPFIARNEFYKSCSSLLSHIGQCYQTVTERYLYRDEKDDPTDLTLELANIREVRMSQSLFAVRELLTKAKREHDYSHSFKYKVFEDLLNSCELILEKTIEARISGVYFHVWEQDKDEDTTQALLSIRRDSVATVIYLFYILSNGFKTRSNIPKYLPSAITIRKRLYDFIGRLEAQREEKSAANETIATQLEKRLASLVNQADYGKSHWTEVHGMAFARAFTTITEELENIIGFSKEILGEEGLFDD